MSRKQIIFGVIMAVIIVAATVTTVALLLPEKAETFTVTFQDFDGTVLKTETVKAGKPASAPAEPKREGYTFFGWDKDFSAITKDLVVKAEYIRNTETTFTVGTMTISPDTKRVEVKVSVTGNPGLLGMVFSVNYDEAALKLVDSQNGLALSALTFQKPGNYKSGCNFVWYGSETGEVMDGEMLCLTFEIVDGTAPGTYPISLSWNDRDIYDSNCDILKPGIVPGGIVITQ